MITERGYGKRTPVSDYPEQNRGGQGVYTIQMTERKGALAAMKVVGPQHELFIITEGATVIRVKTAEISQTGRATQGVKMMSVDDGDRVTAVARMTSAKKEAEDSDETEGGDSSDWWPKARRMPRLPAARSAWTSDPAASHLRTRWTSSPV